MGQFNTLYCTKPNGLFTGSCNNIKIWLWIGYWWTIYKIYQDKIVSTCVYNLFFCSEYESTDSEYDVLQPMRKDDEGSKILNGVTITKAGTYTILLDSNLPLYFNNKYDTL